MKKICKVNKTDINRVYSLSQASADLFNEHVIKKQTGEELENTKSIKTLNEKKIESLELYYGVNSIIKGELGYYENKVREVYGNLWIIEDVLRISKIDLTARLFLFQTKNHIMPIFNYVLCLY